MKKPIVTHVVWFVISMAAMGLGWMLNEGPGDTAGGTADGSPTGSKSSRSASGMTGSASETGNGGAASRTQDSRENAGGTLTGPVLSDIEIEELGEKFRNSANPIERRLAFSKLLEGLTAENAELIREQIAQLPAQSAEFREFHYAWGAVAGVDAVLFGTDTEKADMSPALAGWASADPDAAMAWLQGVDMENNPAFESLLVDRKIPADELRHHLLEGMVKGLAVADPAIATRFIEDLVANGHERTGSMIYAVTEAVLRSGTPGDAALWAEGLQDTQMRGQALSGVAGRYAREDLESAAAWAGGLADQPEAGGAIAKVGSRWATEDPEAAIAWLSDLPAGESQNSGMHWAVREWAGKDPTAAGEYLQEMPPSIARDSAISGYSRRVAWEDPVAAMNWAQTIGTEDQRTSTMIGVAQAWTRKDATSAAEWVAASGLPEEVQRNMLTPPRKDRK